MIQAPVMSRMNKLRRAYVDELYQNFCDIFTVENMNHSCMLTYEAFYVLRHPLLTDFVQRAVWLFYELRLSFFSALKFHLCGGFAFGSHSILR